MLARRMMMVAGDDNALTRRIDDFAGEERAYVGYLIELIGGCPLSDYIRRLEDAVRFLRESHDRASTSSSTELNIKAWDPATDYKKAPLPPPASPKSHSS